MAWIDPTPKGKARFVTNRSGVRSAAAIFAFAPASQFPSLFLRRC